MKTLLFLSALFFAGTTVNLYSLSFNDANYNYVPMNRYSGKKILFVNVASGSPQAYQLAQLQQLYTQHQDSLVVIAFPSNSFGREPKSNAEIATDYNTIYGTSFPIAVKSPVINDSANIIFQWLGSKLQNNVVDFKVDTDFQKVLVDRKGIIIGIFDSSIAPLGTIMQDAIRTSN